MGKMRSFRRSLRNCIGHPLAYDIAQGFGATAAGLLTRVMRGERVNDGEITEMFCGEGEIAEAKMVSLVAGPTIIAGPAKGKNIAIVPVKGVALYDCEYQPICFSTLNLSMIMKQLAADPDIATIILDVDSPGGQVTGTQEAADAVFAARQKKQVIAIVNPLAASAAYWIASQASQIIAVPSADVGSIGVFMSHADCSALNEKQGMKITYIQAGKYKTEGNMDSPLSEDAQAYLQSEVDAIYDKFISAVARGRGVTTTEVLKNYGQGRCMMADMALKLGMIDSIATIDDALAKAGVMVMSAGSGKRSEGDDATKFMWQFSNQDIQALAADTDAEQGVPDLPIISSKGCTPIMLDVRVENDGPKKYFATMDWPDRCVIQNAVFDAAIMKYDISGKSIEIKVENGSAKYQILGVAETDPNAFVCALLSGDFKPVAGVTVDIVVNVTVEDDDEDDAAEEMAAPMDAPSSPDPADPNAEVVAARKLAESRRRRLILENAKLNSSVGAL